MDSFQRNNKGTGAGAEEVNIPRKDILILGHGEIDSNKFIITPEHIDLTFYTSKGEVLKVKVGTNIRSLVLKNGNPEHYIQEKTLLNDMSLFLLNVHSYSFSMGYGVPENYIDAHKIVYSGIITENSDIIPINKLSDEIYSLYNITKRKIEFINKNNQTNVDIKEYIQILNKYLNKNKKILITNNNNLYNEIDAKLDGITESFEKLINWLDASNKDIFFNILSELFIYDFGIPLFFGFDWRNSIFLGFNLLQYLNNFAIGQLEIIVSFIIVHLAYEKSYTIPHIIHLFIQNYNLDNRNYVFNNIINLAYHYHNDEVISKEELAENNFKINLGYLLHKMDVYNKNTLHNQKILCHMLNCRNYIPIEHNKNVIEFRKLVNEGLNEGATGLVRSQSIVNNVTVYRLIRERSASNEYKDLFENIIEKCKNIIETQINHINRLSNKRVNNISTKNVLMEENDLINDIEKTYQDNHFLTKDHIKFLISILRRK